MIASGTLAGLPALATDAARKGATPPMAGPCTWLLQRETPALGNDPPSASDAPHRSEDMVDQGSRIAVTPSAHGKGGVQTARECHRIAVLLATVAAGGSLLWSPRVAPSASTAMKTHRRRAAA